MENLRIALCQHNIVWEDARSTIARIEKPVRRFCAKHRPDLLVFPETYSVGFSMNPSVAEPPDGPSTTWLRRIAGECGTAVVASVPTRIAGGEEGDHRYNRCWFIAPDGTEFHYDKRHLFTPSGESKAYEQGRSRCTVTYRGWRIELNVCYDLRFPVWSRNVDNGYDLLVNIANWPASRIEAADMLLKARATENACYAAFCNRVGRDGLCDYNGKSMLLDYIGHDIARRRRAGGVRFYEAELRMDRLRHYRERFPVSADSDRFEIMV
ncbi:MAG: nitrilase family protein [Bacteroidales bacterium]|nr:nitrilase family protein [Bacteroidales bacterium]